MATPAKIPPKGPPKSDPRAPSTQQLEERAAKKKAMAGIAARGKKKTGRGPSKAAVAATYAKWHAPKVAKAKAIADDARKHLVPMPRTYDRPPGKIIVPPPNPERDAAVGNIRTTPSPLPQPGSSAPPSSSSSSGAVSRDIGWRDPTPSIVPIGRRDRPIDRLTPPSSSSAPPSSSSLLPRKSAPSNAPSSARGMPKPPKSLKRAPGQTNTRSHI